MVTQKPGCQQLLPSSAHKNWSGWPLGSLFTPIPRDPTADALAPLGTPSVVNQHAQHTAHFQVFCLGKSLMVLCLGS